MRTCGLTDMPLRIGAERRDAREVVRFSVPGTLLYRDVVLRVVASACRLGRSGAGGANEPSHRRRVEDFDNKVVSAVGEAFNNVALHAYARARGEAELELGFEPDGLTVRLLDTGAGFNLCAELGQDLETLRESHMGIEIMLSCMDEVTYVRGGPTTPNVLTMTKRYFANAGPSDGRDRVGSLRA
jgi:serine/threonine-protein kinase RsbW